PAGGGALCLPCPRPAAPGRSQGRSDGDPGGFDDARLGQRGRRRPPAAPPHGALPDGEAARAARRRPRRPISPPAPTTSPSPPPPRLTNKNSLPLPCLALRGGSDGRGATQRG